MEQVVQEILLVVLKFQEIKVLIQVFQQLFQLVVEVEKVGVYHTQGVPQKLMVVQVVGVDQVDLLL